MNRSGKAIRHFDFEAELIVELTNSSVKAAFDAWEEKRAALNNVPVMMAVSDEDLEEYARLKKVFMDAAYAANAVSKLD